MSERANHCIDVSQNYLAELGHGILDQLLADRTTGQNILWATSSYDFKGAGFAPRDQMLPELIIGENAGIIQPRVAKAKAARFSRTKSRAEVGTPAWACNVQNNLVDNRWLHYEGAFNRECNQSWLANPHPVFSDDDGRWREYVGDLRLEVACGEAPYLSSRYDMATGEPIEVPRRVGILDRKLRVVGENSYNRGQWLEWAYRALESVYGFELQGDSLFIARKNLLLTFAEHYMDRFGVYPSPKSLKIAAGILSWNLWQMDARTFAVPFEKVPERPLQLSLFDQNPVGKIRYCLVKDWGTGETCQFKSIIDRDGDGHG